MLLLFYVVFYLYLFFVFFRLSRFGSTLLSRYGFSFRFILFLVLPFGCFDFLPVFAVVLSPLPRCHYCVADWLSFIFGF